MHLVGFIIRMVLDNFVLDLPLF